MREKFKNVGKILFYRYLKAGLERLYLLQPLETAGIFAITLNTSTT